MIKKESSQKLLSLAIAIPTSFIDVYSSKAQKTQQIGRIARASAIFQVNEILLFKDRKNQKQAENLQLISSVLEYIETPQYLRKHLFAKLPELQYVGLLPPLRTPHHPLVKKASQLKQDEIREGVAFQQNGNLVVDVGVELPLPLVKSNLTRFPQRITVQITRTKAGNLIAAKSSPPRVQPYWGYKVRCVDRSLGKFLKIKQDNQYVIATSRKGKPVEELAKEIRTKWQNYQRLLLLFGSYNEGLAEILQREHVDIADVVDYSVNLVQSQGTATIRTEEAVQIGLTVFRYLECIQV
ncbi:MAG: putative RNA uridine N3 methyltransferase [Promethearchaeota archaeon]